MEAGYSAALIMFLISIFRSAVSAEARMQLIVNDAMQVLIFRTQPYSSDYTAHDEV